LATSVHAAPRGFCFAGPFYILGVLFTKRVGVRVKRSPSELRDALSEQVALLQLSAANFDGGAVVAGKQLAATLRVLLYAPTHGRKGRTTPLLHQLGLIGHRFLDTCLSMKPEHLSVLQNEVPKGPLPICGLVDVQFWLAALPSTAP
jgi:hypothetical protein